MDALLYLITLAFSGADAVRALALCLVGGLFISKRFPPWKMTVLLLLIDLAWPYVTMFRDAAGHREVELALRGSLIYWQDNLAAFLVRSAGFYLFLRGSFSLRRKLHEWLPEEEKKPGLLPF